MDTEMNDIEMQDRDFENPSLCVDLAIAEVKRLRKLLRTVNANFMAIAHVSNALDHLRRADDVIERAAHHD